MPRKSTRKIKLSKGQHTIIDSEDYDRVMQHRWFCTNIRGRLYAYGYAGEKGKKKSMSMHRFIIGAKKGQITDHKNRNTLDNRKENLRLCTTVQNNTNSLRKNTVSGYKGVSHAKGDKWHARIKVNGKYIFIGSFKDKLEAARAYNKAAKIHWGEFACLNKIPRTAPPAGERK